MIFDRSLIREFSFVALSVVTVLLALILTRLLILLLGKAAMGDVPAEAVVKAFLTEPAIGNGSDISVYLEVIDVVEAGDADGVLKEFVEILR